MSKVIFPSGTVFGAENWLLQMLTDCPAAIMYEPPLWGMVFCVFTAGAVPVLGAAVRKKLCRIMPVSVCLVDEVTSTGEADGARIAAEKIIKTAKTT
jgi:hypothetical protein